MPKMIKDLTSHSSGMPSWSYILWPLMKILRFYSEVPKPSIADYICTPGDPLHRGSDISHLFVSNGLIVDLGRILFSANQCMLMHQFLSAREGTGVLKWKFENKSFGDFFFFLFSKNILYLNGLFQRKKKVIYSNIFFFFFWRNIGMRSSLEHFQTSLVCAFV